MYINFVLKDGRYSYVINKKDVLLILKKQF